MAIRSRNRLAVPYRSEAFPPGSTPNGNGSLSVSWDRVVWAALTIGRPPTHHVFQHGTSSFYEAIFRISLVRMALDQSGPFASRLRRSAAFKALDPTEKGAISYFLGMTFCKVFSSKLLRTPWLLHLDAFRAMATLPPTGRSRPDLIGQQTGTGNWISFETKGRASKPTFNDISKAKTQAQRVLSVNGTACTLHIGTFAYFLNDVLNFHWVDPPTEAKRPITLPDPRDLWSHYYGPTKALWEARADESPKRDGGLIVSLPEFDVTLKIHPLLAPFFLVSAWEGAQRELLTASEELEADGFQDDGIKVECGPTWLDRFGSDLVDLG